MKKNEITLNLEKCERVYNELENAHTSYGENEFTENIKLWTSSAREIEVDLFNRKLNGEITHEEYTYIFGMVCRCALNCSKGDFWRA